MKIGDKVRFISSVGGGKIAGFQSNNIVLVEDEDGFQIPTPANDVVVVNDDDYSISRMVSQKQQQKKKAYNNDDEDEDYEDAEEGFDFGDEDTTVYEVKCACGNIIDFDEDVLESGSIVCPNCGETLEFTFEDVEDEE